MTSRPVYQGVVIFDKRIPKKTLSVKIINKIFFYGSTKTYTIKLNTLIKK